MQGVKGKIHVQCLLIVSQSAVFDSQFSFIHRIYILRECFTVAQQANKVIQNALEDPDIPMSPNELRWLGSSVYNVGCVSYKSDCFAEGVPLLALACDELKIWSFGAETEEKIVLQAEEVQSVKFVKCHI